MKLSIRQIADREGTSVKSVYRWLADGLVHYDLIGGIKVEEADLEEFLARKPRVLPPLLTRSELLKQAIKVHGQPCIYFLILAGEIVYVGKTVNVTKRLGRHLQDGKQFDSYALVECQARDLARLEMAYIMLLKPRYNVMGIIEPVDG